MIPIRGYAVKNSSSRFEPFQFERREVGAHDVLIKILYCGVCHSDIHEARNELGGSIYPMVPGHEIVGRVERIGAQVSKFNIGEIVGVGCIVDSCRICESCKAREEQYCVVHVSYTYNGTEQDKTTPTYGGYSSQIVVDQRYVFKISPKLAPANVAPLLCAGITTYSPLRYHKVSPGQHVGIIGLGGLGHLALKFAVSMGADVTLFSTSSSKEQDARRLGAQKFVVTKEIKALEPLASSLDLIIDTVSAQHNLESYLNLLKKDGVLVLLGIPEKPLELPTWSLIQKRRTVTGSFIGGTRETQEMLDYCAEKGITSDIELIPIQDIEKANERIVKGDVRYRFVIDMSTL